MDTDFQRQQQLRDARIRDQREKARKNIKKQSTGRNKGAAKNTLNEAKAAMDLAKSITPWGIFRLMLQFNPMIDWTFGVAFFAALLKDILNYSEATSGYCHFLSDDPDRHDDDPLWNDGRKKESDAAKNDPIISHSYSYYSCRTVAWREFYSI